MNLAHPSINLADILYALGDATRLQIARNLYAAQQPLTCTEAVQSIDDLAVSTRSHCFKVLRERGVIVSEMKGRECFNSLRQTEIERRYPGLLRAVLATPVAG